MPPYLFLKQGWETFSRQQTLAHNTQRRAELF